MLANISTISLNTLYQNEESFDNFYDVFLVDSESHYHDTQEFLEQNNTFIFITLEETDLAGKEVLVKAIYEAVMDEPAGSDNVRENIEAIEEELDEVNCCVLGLPDFHHYDAETQAVLLELAIVSESFKLLLCIDRNSLSENLSLWKVLLNRTLVIDEQDGDESTAEDTGSSYEDEYEYDADGVEEEQLGNKEAAVEKAWYQMIPKYHLAIALVLVFIILALWNMDLAKTREESVPLKASMKETNKTTSENQVRQNILENEQVKNNKTTKIEFDNVENKKVEQDTDTIKKSDEEVRIIEEVRQKDVLNQKNETAVVEEAVIEKPVAGTSTAAVEENGKQDLGLHTDWRPYQSNSWIKGLNKDYFTLQLMASHSEKGVRDFLEERGVSSQYAVYTIEKDGKPWHVIVYGVYQTREFADLARKDLPSYLKAYSPWIRSIADIQIALP